MKRNDNFDGQFEGQLSFADMFEPPERLVAVSKIFARARKEMSLAEQKTFVYALSELRFKEEAKSNIVYLDKKTLARIVNVNTDNNHLSVDLHNKIKYLPPHSYIEVSKQDIGLYDSGTIINRVTMLKNRVRIKFEEEYLGLFTGLSKDYITMWSTDIFQMQSKRSVQFYELLRQNTDTREAVNNVGLGIHALKDMFGIPKDGDGSYMRKDGHFNRPAFEKYVIDPICTDMQNCKMIQLVMQPDGKLYEKVKAGKRVLGYRFYWSFSAYPKQATAEEIKQLQERVDKNPKVLKIAKDLAQGQKKKTNQTNAFNNIDQREYDFDELEKMLLQSQVIEDE